MDDERTIEERLTRSARMAREWNWMGAISTRREEAIRILGEEARSLIALMPEHPDQAVRISRIVVCYKRLIDGIKCRPATGAGSLCIAENDADLASLEDPTSQEPTVLSPRV